MPIKLPNKQKIGYLYLVSTPIGNLEDITIRAIRILKSVDIIAAEDTRHTKILLDYYGIKNRLESYHDFNKEKKTEYLIKEILIGHTIAVVSNAGTPGVQDPAFNLVRAAIKESIDVIPIPGATAAIAAITVSGLPTDRFIFEGFLPVKKGRKSRLEGLVNEPRTIILYESPHRLIRTLSDLLNILGDRSVVMCREMTKKFEEFCRGSISEMIQLFSRRKVKGEFVIVIQGDLKKRHVIIQ